MKAYFSDDPIVAVSTGTTEKSALGIIRLSGFKDLSFLPRLIKRKLSPESHKVYFSRFYGKDGSILDEGVLTYFKAPKSFTGENTLEITVHGNPFNLERIVQYLTEEFEFRPAEPGEFSYRALRNNKLNLTQVEGLDLLLNASSSFGLNAGLKALNNDLHESYMSLRHHLLELKASVELLIDFSEDVGEEEIWSKINQELYSLKKMVNSLKKRTEGNLSELLNPSISLIGPTNAGKSTFFNKLLGRNRAIVSDIHGTTRDFISEFIYIKGQAFNLIDTAGLRENAEEVERIGIKQSLEINKKSFFKVLVLNPFSPQSLDQKSLEIDALVLTHSDLPGFEVACESFSKQFPEIPIFKSGPIGAGEEVGPIGPVGNSGSIGAKNINGPIGADEKSGPMGAVLLRGPIGPDKKSGPMGAGESLEDFIFEEYQLLMEGNPIAIQRHRNVISAIYDKLNKIYREREHLSDAAILSHHINILAGLFDELVGIVSPQEVLDHIFANFCIGK